VSVPGDSAAPETAPMPRKKKAPLLLLLGCGGLGCGGLLLVGIVAGVLLLRPGGSPSGLLSLGSSPESGQDSFKASAFEEINYLPDDFYELESLRMEQMRGTRVYAALPTTRRAALNTEKDHLGQTFDPHEVDRLTKVNLHHMEIFSLRNKITAEEINARQKSKYEPVTVGKYTIYVQKEVAFCVPIERVAVFSSRKILEAVLTRDGKPRMTPIVQTAMDIMFTSAGSPWLVRTNLGPIPPIIPPASLRKTRTISSSMASAGAATFLATTSSSARP
jgi:hypothetical protein